MRAVNEHGQRLIASLQEGGNAGHDTGPGDKRGNDGGGAEGKKRKKARRKLIQSDSEVRCWLRLL